VIHGDLFDVVIRHARWLALLGDKAYDLAIWLNTHFSAIRRAFGLTYWSLSQWAKLKVKNAVNFIGAFEQALAGEARRRGADGVICGHIHHAVIRGEAGFSYINCGDWIESCTAVVEHFDGRFEIVKWTPDGQWLANMQPWPAALQAVQAIELAPEPKETIPVQDFSRNASARRDRSAGHRRAPAINSDEAA
jgi:hypothetical protein